MGSGDGRGPYRWASRDAGRLFIASDTNASALLDTAWRAARKPARGGIPNLLCIAEPLNVLAAELGQVADRVTVILPWGGLLTAVATPDINSLQDLAGLCLPDATIEIVFSYDSSRDARENGLFGVGGPDAGTLDERHVTTTLPRIYQRAGLEIVIAEKIAQRELAAFETTWAKRLAFGRPREVWRVRARRSSLLK